ncbi:MAG: hypothetical protein ACOCV4_09000 [Myxococcota bacterium]
MTASAWMLLTWVLLGAVFLVLHALALWQGLRPGELTARWRWVALFPPATPVVAWVNGARVGPVLWGVVLVTYAILRLAWA